PATAHAGVPGPLRACHPLTRVATRNQFSCPVELTLLCVIGTPLEHVFSARSTVGRILQQGVQGGSREIKTPMVRGTESEFSDDPKRLRIPFKPIQYTGSSDQCIELLFSDMAEGWVRKVVGKCGGFDYVGINSTEQLGLIRLLFDKLLSQPARDYCHLE